MYRFYNEYIKNSVTVEI